MKVFSTKTEKRLISILSAAVFIVIWKLVSLRIGTDIILPPPERVFLRLAVIIQSAAFRQAVGATALRTLYGLFISFVLGFSAGIACGSSGRIDAFLSPMISLARTAPVMSVILLAMIWFRTDLVPVFVGVLMIFPIITANVRQGVKQVDPKLLELGRAYRLTRYEVLREITIPSVVPFVLAGLRSGIGIAWKVVIAAEVLSQPVRAIGTGLQFSQASLETADVIAWTAAAVILSWLSESALDMLIKKYRWEGVRNG